MKTVSEDAKMMEVYRSVFSTPEGKLVLEDLNEEFISLSIADIGSAHVTTIRAAQRDVIFYINNMVKVPK